MNQLNPFKCVSRRPIMPKEQDFDGVNDKIECESLEGVIVLLKALIAKKGSERGASS